MAISDTRLAIAFRLLSRNNRDVCSGAWQRQAVVLKYSNVGAAEYDLKVVWFALYGNSLLDIEDVNVGVYRDHTMGAIQLTDLGRKWSTKYLASDTTTQKRMRRKLAMFRD